MANFKDILKSHNLPVSNLIEEIADPLNISESFDYVVSHLECAAQRDHIRPKKEQYCKTLEKLLRSGDFRITPNDFRQMEVTDGPKARIVQCPSVFHRVGCHAVMVPFERHSHVSLIKNTAASIKGRGMHWLHDIIEHDLHADPDGMKYYYQCDIYHYYDSIDQKKMKEQLRMYTTDPLVLPMIDNFVELLPEGLSKGLRSSQSFANLHLSEIDHMMNDVVDFHDIPAVASCGDYQKRIHGKDVCFHYYRYCDDIVFFAGNKKQLWELRNYLVSLLAELGLHVKPSEAVRPISEGVDYLGYVTYADDSEGERTVYSRIRKRTKQKFARRINRVKSRKRRKILIGSFFGMAAHADCRHLLKKLITPNEFRKLKHKRKMKDFGKFKLAPSTLDGKKNLHGKKIPPRELNGQGFIVFDFERGIVAKRDKDEYLRKLQDAAMRNMPEDLVEKPKDKYICQVIYHPALNEIWLDHSIYDPDPEVAEKAQKRLLARLKDILEKLKEQGELSNMVRKMWTGDREIWSYLNELEKLDELPFFVGIEMDYSGQYPKAHFVSAEKFGMRAPTPREEDVILNILNLRKRNS